MPSHYEQLACRGPARRKDNVMIYTAYEMVKDCRAHSPEGWRYFVRQYVPVIRKLLAHYAPESRLEAVLEAVSGPESPLFGSLEPMPERPFVAELRQSVVTGLEPPAASIELDLTALAAALEPLTLVEKQAAWLETMAYSPPESGEMLRMSAVTVEKIRTRAAELIRQQAIAWNTRLVAENGRALGHDAAAARGADCLPSKTFLEVVDGRMTWHGRERLEQHVLGCWHCIDHFCRLLEAVEMLRGIRPLTEEEAVPFDRLLGIQAEKRRGWKKWFGA